AQGVLAQGHPGEAPGQGPRTGSERSEGPFGVRAGTLATDRALPLQFFFRSSPYPEGDGPQHVEDPQKASLSVTNKASVLWQPRRRFLQRAVVGGIALAAFRVPGAFAEELVRTPAQMEAP